MLSAYCLILLIGSHFRNFPKSRSFKPSKTTFSCLLRSSGVAFCRAAVVSSRIRSRWTFRMKKSRAGSIWILGSAWLSYENMGPLEIQWLIIFFGKNCHLGICSHLGMCIYMHVHMHMHIHIIQIIHMHRHVHTLCMYLCIYVSMYPCIHVSTYPCIHVSMYLCIYICMNE